ncbi:TatD family hydrolase [Idiomarina sp.]|uniref:TatD family hydrolase n=1 Tax=Idiomarina sp. TaxID=1874361 RepID=UPI0025BD7CA9|nr:TatD family hydrolase [Idiomarina sp.]
MWFDAGVNLTNARLLNNLDGVMERARAAGVTRQLIIATNESEAQAAITLCERYPEQLVTTIGVHPHDAAGVSANYLERLTELAKHPAVVAIGECGLDFNRNYSPPEQQIKVFSEQIQLANRLDLPLYLHERDAREKQIQLLDKLCSASTECISHCFTGGPEDAKAYKARGHWFGITGWLCDERRNQALVEALPLLPQDQLLIETDAPFLLPRTIRPRPKFNEPHWLPEVGCALAQHLNLSQGEVAKLTSDNAYRLFALSEAGV